MRRTAISLFSVLCCLVLLTAPAQAEKGEASWLDNRWPQERSEIRPDPSVAFGRLENGFRYALIPNAKPEGRVSVYLAVEAGSLMETDAQLGLAHYVEHMAFEGSRSFPPGSLIPFFQKNGMSFGGDTNAYTSYTETVYMLDLAASNTENLKQGLLVLRDFADGVSFEEKEVEQERGIILAEKTVRDSEQFRAYRHYMASVFPNSRFSNMPIGEESVIKGATSASLRAFYETWYKPERMILVAVGSADPAVLEPMIREAFKDMKSSGPAPVVPVWGSPKHKGVQAFTDKRDLGRTMVSITAMGERWHESDSLLVQQDALLRDLCSRLMQRRLQEREQADSTLWSGADVDMERVFGLFPSASLQAAMAGDGWERALRTLEIELREVLDRGFTSNEFEESKAELAAQLEQAVKERSNRTNSSVALSFVSACNSDRVYTSPEQDETLYKEFSAGLTLADINTFFDTVWAKGNRLLYVSGNAVIPDGAKAVVAAYDAARATVLPGRAEAALEPFPYLPVPEAHGALPGLTERAFNEGKLRVLSGSFANGTSFQLVPSTLSQGQVSVHLWFGQGMRSLPETLVPPAQLAEAVLSRNGPGKLTRLESHRRFDKFSLEVGESFRENFFSITGNAPKAYLEMLLQAVWTEFVDPVPRAEALEEARRDLTLAHYNRYNTVPGVLRDEQGPFFSGPAARKRALTDADASRLSLDDIKAAIALTRQTPVRHLVIIGDFDPKDVLPQAQALFGSTSLSDPRHTPPVPAAPVPGLASGLASGPQLTPPLPAQFPAGQTRVVKAPDTVDKAVVLAAWRRDLPPDTPKRTDVMRQILSEVVNEQVREELRQKLGASYSPSAGYQVQEVKTGYALFLAMVGTDVAQCDAVRAALDTVMADLRRNGVDPAMLDRVRPPMLTSWKTARGTNGYWLGLLMREYLTGQPHADWNDSIPELVQSITKAELDAEAAAVFSPEGRAELVVVQDPKAEKR